MAKNKKTEIPHYELLYIVSNEYTEEELKPIIEKVGKFITDNGGEITFQEAWGKKKLAYKIGKFSYGYYNLLEFDLVGEKLNALDKAMRMSTDIIRFMIVARPKRNLNEIEEQKRVEKEYRDTHKNAANQKKEEKLKREEKKSAKKSVSKKTDEKKEDKEKSTKEITEKVVEKKEIKEDVKKEKKEETKKEKIEESKDDAKKEKPKSKKKVDLDELDEKLDKILETNDLL